MKLEFIRDNTPTFEFQVQNEDGSPANIAGATITLLAKRNQSDLNSAAVITKNAASGIAITDPVNGIFQCTMFPQDSASFTQVTDLWVDVLIVTLSGGVFTVSQGDMRILMNTTRPS